MEEIKAPKKEKKFLKAIGNIALTLFRELVLGIGKKLINKVGNKRQGLVIAFALIASISYAAIDSIPYPVTGNKQRLGFQTTGNGLVYRGRSEDTITKPSSYVDKNVKAYLLLDSVRGTIFVWRQTFWDSLIIGGGVATPFDTSSLNLVNRFAEKLNIADTSILNLQSRFDLKLNLSDTAAMLLPYATKSYVDTAGRFYARQDFTNVDSSTLTWTQTDTLVPSGVNVVMVYRNGQILLTSQYTIPTKTSVVIAATSFKVGENYTVIFPKGGGGSGGGGGGGSGSLTSISGGTGILVSPDPITTTGTVSADLSVLMELTDTSLLNLTSRFASKLNTTDTASLSTRIDAKGNGTVTSIATGYGLTGGTITTTGTLLLDSAVVFSRIRDSIVDLAIGNDTIRILKQEYAPATTSVLTWTITPKFPIQLKAYILVFRNGQLLINDQYNLTDTNKITIVSNSFKVGSNYTVVTVSGIGSVGSAQASNPVYPEVGIALSTGSTWASSIPNNSTNWNTAFTDRLKWDGSSTGLVATTGRTSLGGSTIGQSMFTLTNPSAITFPRFNADNTVTARSAADFRADIGAGTGSGNGTVTSVIAAATAGNPLSITNNTTTPTIELLSATSGRNGYLTSTDWTTFNGKQNAITLTTTGTSGAATLVGATLNIPQYSGGGGGSGTVTSVGFTAPSIFSVGGSPVTTSGTLALTYSGAPLPILNGGTAATTISQARVNLQVPRISTTITPQAPLTGGGSLAGDRIISIPVATSIANGYLSSADFVTFNAKGNGTVTNITVTSPITITNPSTTPNITITDASTGASGVVNTTTQSFAGNKTFSGTVTLSSVSGTATSVIGRSITGQVVGLTLGSGLSLASGTLSATANNDVNIYMAINGPGIYLSSSFGVYSHWYVNINQSSTVTITLPSAPDNIGKTLIIKNSNSGAVNSQSSNVEPLNSTVLGTAIMTSGGGKYATLVSNGTNWIKMSGN